MDATSTGVVVLDQTGRVRVWSPEARRLLGWTAAEVRGRALERLLAPELERGWRRLRGECDVESEPDAPDSIGHSPILEGGVLGKDGTYVTLSLTLAGGDPQMQVVLLRDPSIWRAREERLSLLESGVDMVDGAIAVASGRRPNVVPRIIYSNRSFRSIFGAPDASSIEGRRVSDLLGRTDWRRIATQVKDGLKRSGKIGGRARMPRPPTDPDQNDSPWSRRSVVEWEVVPLEPGPHSEASFLTMVRPVPARREVGSEEGGGRSSSLASQEHFLARLGRSVRWATERDDRRFVLLLVDVEGLDSSTGNGGDSVRTRLVRALGWRLRRCVRPLDPVAPLGQTRLGVLLEGAGPLEELASILAQIRRKMAAPFLVEGRRIFLSGHIGVVLSDSGYRRTEVVIRDAEGALLRSRTEGRPERYAIHDEDRYRSLLDRARLIGRLRTTFKRHGGNPVLFSYQPMVRLETDTVEGLEALLHWRHHSAAALDETSVRELAAEGDLLFPLGRVTVQRICRQIARWKKAGGEGAIPRVGFNVSARQLEDPRFPDYLEETLRRHGVEGRELALEVEGVAPAGTALDKTFARIRTVGLEIWLDGFGANGAIPVALDPALLRGIKLAPSWLAEPGTTEPGVDLMAAALDVVREAGMTTVATGVERPDQCETARAAGIDLVQGPLFREAWEAAVPGEWIPDPGPGHPITPRSHS